jgi:hypothetical protein
MGEVVKRITIWEGSTEQFITTKTPKQRLPINLLEIYLRQGKASVSEEGKALGSELRYMQSKSK